METIAICICTYKRPKMLTKCFLSLAQQEFMKSWNIFFVIVDNDPMQENKDLINTFKNKTKFTVFYVHQPHQGIAIARNTAIDKALQFNADWICFFDDDQYVRANTLREAFFAARFYQADVVAMFVRLVYEGQINDPSKIRGRDDGVAIKTCGTGGVLFDKRLITKNGFNLRFDERLGLSIGEDVIFFHNASSRGAKIVSSRRAEVYETVVPERMKLGFLCYSKFCIASFKYKYFCNLADKGNRVRVLVNALIKGVGVVELFFLPIYFIFSIGFSKKRLFKICGKLFWFLGVLSAVFQFSSPRRYKNIDGY